MRKGRVGTRNYFCPGPTPKVRERIYLCPYSYPRSNKDQHSLNGSEADGYTIGPAIVPFPIISRDGNWVVEAGIQSPSSPLIPGPYPQHEFEELKAIKDRSTYPTKSKIANSLQAS